MVNPLARRPQGETGNYYKGQIGDRHSGKYQPYRDYNSAGNAV
jgi:hypothetical protein